MKKRVLLLVALLLMNSFTFALPQGWEERQITSIPPSTENFIIPGPVYKDTDGRISMVYMWYHGYGQDYDLHYAKIDANGNVIHREITPREFGIQADPQVAALGAVPPSPSGAWVAWTDNRIDRGSRIFLQKIDNNGNRLLSQDRVISSNNPSVSSASSPTIALNSNQDLYIIWSDNRNGPLNTDLYMTKLDRYGNAYPTIDNKRLTTHPTGSSLPHVTVNPDNTLNLVWSDDRDGNAEIYFARFDSNGNRLTNEMRVTNSAGNVYWDLTSVLGQNGLYIGWTDSYLFPQGHFILTHITKINPQNGQVLILPLHISAEGGSGTPPALAVDRAGRLHVVFVDGYENPYRFNVAYNIYSEESSRFRQVTSLGVTNSGEAVFYPWMLFDSQDAYIAFSDARSNPWGDLYLVNSKALIEFLNVRPGQTSTMKITNLLWPNTPVQAALSSSTSPRIALPDGRYVDLNPDPLFFLSLGFLSGQLNDEGQATFFIPLESTVPRGLRFYGAAVAYHVNEPMPQGIKYISKSYQGVVS